MMDWREPVSKCWCVNLEDTDCVKKKKINQFQEIFLCNWKNVTKVGQKMVVNFLSYYKKLVLYRAVWIIIYL